MTRTQATRKPALPLSQPPPPPPPTETCTDCWRTDRRELVRLRCGHVCCSPCVAARARVAMGASASMLPLRCCYQPVQAAVLAKVLSPPELAFYQHRTALEVETKRQFVADATTVVLATACDFCSQTVYLVTADDVNKLQPCGHVYCDDCRTGLHQAAAEGENTLCCVELLRPADGASADAHAGEPTMAAEGRDVVANQANVTVALVDPSVAPPTRSRSKRKTPDAAVEATGVDATDAQSDRCVVCSVGLHGIKTAVLTSCGHAFCRACLKQRCQRAVVNEDEGSIGVPVRCCNVLVPVDIVRPALSKRVFTKYEALVAKRADAIATIPVKTTTRKATRAKAAPRSEPDAKRPRVNVDAETVAGEPTEHCVSCMADLVASDQLRGPCGHVYCLSCLATMARLSLADRALVPIRCCSQEFPAEYVRRALPKTKAAQYERFLAEKDWRQSDLKSDREYARVVKKVRGKQCPTCGIGVQKVLGCSTMYCPHGHVFCWKCVASPCAC